MAWMTFVPLPDTLSSCNRFSPFRSPRPDVRPGSADGKRGTGRATLPDLAPLETEEFQLEEHLARKLTAILYADVADYSRLTGEDEDATHRRLSEYLDIVSETVTSHRGSVVHYAGDAVLARFDAVLDALAAAIAIQDTLRERNRDLPAERRVVFRIGVNLGDVIEDRADIFGDGVNVAARLEGVAEPGGICISESVRTAIGNRLPQRYEFLGERQVKNIEEPIRAYRVVPLERKPANRRSRTPRPNCPISPPSRCWPSTT